MWRGRNGPDDGNAALELIILAPVLIALIGLVIAAGRTTLAQGSVAAAARDAARQASIARSPAEAQQEATSSATTALNGDGLNCQPQAQVLVNTNGFGVPIGQPAEVTATVICEVPLSDLWLPGAPGSKRLIATFSSPLDPYRGR
jgi:Flp pilus assembly protein TadG